MDISSSYLPTITNVYKEHPDFSLINTQQMLDQKQSDACISMTTVMLLKKKPDCKNNCGNYNITQDLGYLSAKDYMEKKLALRSVLNNSTDYESTMMKNIHGYCP